MSASVYQRTAVTNRNATSASGTTPIKNKSASAVPNKENEKAQSSRDALKDEIQGLCFTVDHDIFYDAFFKSKDQEPGAEELEACLDHLRNIGDQDCRYYDPPHSQNHDGSYGFKAILQTKRETDIYKKHAKLFTAIAEFARARCGDDIDAGWPRAQEPLPSKAPSLPSDPDSPSTPTPGVLHRHFVYCPNKATRPISTTHNPAELKLDMAMVIAKPENKPSYEREHKQPQYHWKHVLLPIEVKLKYILGQDTALQTASYVRMVRAEQADRNFVYSLTINNEECRIWRWDTSACYVSQPISIHNRPLDFIRLIWRLSTMTPEEFGYDPNFSNSGRVLVEEVGKISTTLTVHGVAPKTSPITSPASRESQQAKTEDKIVREDPTDAYQEQSEQETKKELYHLTKKLFQSHGLFSRNTVVWEAELLDEHQEPISTVVIKQNWQDATRESEASYYDQANEISKGIAHLRISQELEKTNDWYRLLLPGSLTRQVFGNPETGGQSNPTSESTQSASQGSSAPMLERILIRMVFTGVGKPLFEAKDSEHLVSALLDAVEAMEELYRKGIMHRDISANNILLNGEPQPEVGNRGLLIDLGLAQRFYQLKTDDTLQVNVHNHRTGTLPFMATDLLKKFRTVQHEIHHDLESIFWVLYYVCLKACPPKTGPTAAWTAAEIAALDSRSTTDLHQKKFSVLGESDDIQLLGKHAGLLPAVRTFAEMCYNSLNRSAGRAEGKRLTFNAVKAVLRDALCSLQQTPPSSIHSSPKRSVDTAGFNPQMAVPTSDESGKSTKRGRIER